MIQDPGDDDGGIVIPGPVVDLSAEALDIVAPRLRELYPDFDHMIDVAPRADHVPLMQVIEDMFQHFDTATAGGRATRLLLKATRPSGTIDPNDHRGDVPWASMLVKLVDNPSLGAAVSCRWFRHLRSVGHEGLDCSSSTVSVAAYCAGFFEMSLGNEANWWLIAASTPAEPEGARLGLVSLFRAARLLGPVVRRTRWGGGR